MRLMLSLLTPEDHYLITPSVQTTRRVELVKECLDTGGRAGGRDLENVLDLKELFVASNTELMQHNQ